MIGSCKCNLTKPSFYETPKNQGVKAGFQAKYRTKN